jgi:hypothetical protein
MSDPKFQDFSIEGQTVRVEVLDVINIDSVLTSEAQIVGYEVAARVQPEPRRVERSIRDMLVRFGVSR